MSKDHRIRPPFQLSGRIPFGKNPGLEGLGLEFGHFRRGTNVKPEVDAVDRRAAARQISPGALALGRR